MESYEQLAARYLRTADRFLPGRVIGFYLIGSTALGAFRPGRSDLDFVAVVDGPFSAREMARVRAVHLAAAAGSGWRAATRGYVSMPGTCNGSYIDAADLARPVSELVPLASHTAGRFSTGKAFDVNPVMWKVFAERGIAVRGAEPATLGLDPQPELLRPWNAANLAGYWAEWARTLPQGTRWTYRIRPRWMTAWGVLGAPRLHCTIATGDVISKEAAGDYARMTFDREWHPIIDDALAYWRQERTPRPLAFDERIEQTAAFTAMVAGDPKVSRSSAAG